MTTTVFCEYEGNKRRVPVRSSELVDVDKIFDIKKKLREKKVIDSNQFFVEYNDDEVKFDVYKGV